MQAVEAIDITGLVSFSGDHHMHGAKFQLTLWQADAEPVLQGPEFEGRAPFPSDTPTV